MGRALQVGQRSSALTCMCHSQELGEGGAGELGTLFQRCSGGGSWEHSFKGVRYF